MTCIQKPNSLLDLTQIGSAGEKEAPNQGCEARIGRGRDGFQVEGVSPYIRRGKMKRGCLQRCIGSTSSATASNPDSASHEIRETLSTRCKWRGAAKSLSAVVVSSTDAVCSRSSRLKSQDDDVTGS